MPPNHFESEVESFLEGSHGDRTHIKRADHHTVTPLCGTLLGQVARSETAIAFADAGRASTETAIAFAGEKWAVLVQFSGAEVMVVSMVAVQGRA
ncbi:hypothetical protein, partial [Sanguibacter keddieii]|uniref:hypothetical protein n=1 Tax=Sanguibacter keddieii TaxID=60920 RepID=UPI0019552938